MITRFQFITNYSTERNYHVLMFHLLISQIDAQFSLIHLQMTERRIVDDSPRLSHYPLNQILFSAVVEAQCQFQDTWLGRTWWTGYERGEPNVPGMPSYFYNIFTHQSVETYRHPDNSREIGNVLNQILKHESGGSASWGIIMISYLETQNKHVNQKTRLIS